MVLAIALVAALHVASLLVLHRFRRWHAAGGVL
jgi:hypothetical protein